MTANGRGPLFFEILFMKSVTIQGVELFRFSNMQDWINRASQQFARYKKPGEPFDTAAIVCIDSQGRMCGIGADFKDAEYPVIAYRLERVARDYRRW